MKFNEGTLGCLGSLLSNGLILSESKTRRSFSSAGPSFVGIFVVHPGRAIGDSLKQLTGESNSHQSLGKDHWVAWMKEKAWPQST